MADMHIVKSMQRNNEKVKLKSTFYTADKLTITGYDNGSY